MEVELVRTFAFEAAHSLPNAPAGHKCRRLHGHSYRVDVHLTGQVDERTGWLMDFADIQATVQPAIDEIDHRNLNDIPELANPTSEMLARYLWDKIRPALPNLSAVTVWESEKSGCTYRGK